MGNDLDVIIVCGGQGSRMGKLAKKYGCKSLIPLKGIPTISYLTDTIRRVVPDSRIILATDSPELKKKLERVCDKQSLENYHIYDGLPRGPVQAFYEAGSLCKSEKVLIFFGNQLVSTDHIRRLLAHEEETLVLSAFEQLSENNCKVATINEDSRVIDVTRYDHLAGLKKSEVYLDVPYCVPNNFFSMETFPEIKRLFVKTPMRKVPLNREERVVVDRPDLPPEFHFKKELDTLERLVGKHFSSTIDKLGYKFNE
ncbi:MAG: nucleotidyltransferase family protein [Nanoarchaeota archaeon]|nr:nucleotidyltransferase family protein [Nanoarchaeota archaeon]